jgi:excisionase family DNA binding protein
MDKLITGSEAAERLGCHHRTVRRWVENGWIEGQVVGDRLVIAAASVEAVERRRVMLTDGAVDPEAADREEQT